MIACIAVACIFLPARPAQSPVAKQINPQTPVADTDRDHIKERNEWFDRGRIVRGLPSAELRRKAYRSKVAMQAQRADTLAQPNRQFLFSVSRAACRSPRMPAGADTEDHHQVAGRVRRKPEEGPYDGESLDAAVRGLEKKSIQTTRKDVRAAPPGMLVCMNDQAMRTCTNKKCVAYGHIVYSVTTRCPLCKCDLRATLPASEVAALYKHENRLPATR